MASSLPTTTAPLPKAAVSCHTHCPSRSPSGQVSFGLSSKPKLRFFAKGLAYNWNASTVVKAQANEVGVDGSSNMASVSPSNSGDGFPESKDIEQTLATEESISEFISQVSNLVKLVDSKDIVELQLKQLDCEILIRKKEALAQMPVPPPSVMFHAPSPQLVPTKPLPAPASAPSAPSPSSPVPSAPKAVESSFPPLKCPMAGTFYRSPAPGEPPFVKKGDKVQKGQVLCIIEAMKLMNEIEADQSGTIVEIIAEDGKPVSIDTPLFVIKP